MRQRGTEAAIARRRPWLRAKRYEGALVRRVVRVVRERREGTVEGCATTACSGSQRSGGSLAALDGADAVLVEVEV